MTLPPYMPKPEGDLEKIEASCAFSLVNNNLDRNPRYCSGTNANDYAISIGTLHNGSCRLPEVSKHPLGLELAASVADNNFAGHPRAVTPQSTPEHHANMANLEANCVLFLANKFAKNPCYCVGANANDYAISIATPDTYRFQLPEAYPFTNIETAIAPPPAPVVVASVANTAVIERPRIVTPQPSLERPAKKARTVSPGKSDLSDKVSTENDPPDESFCKSLYLIEDECRLNPGHVLLRKKLVDIRRTRSGTVFFQCAGCRHLPSGDRVNQSTITPRRVANLYRGVVRFMMNHTYKCGFISQADKDICEAAKSVKFNDTKAYWIKSAKAIGLRDAGEGQGIVYCKPL